MKYLNLDLVPVVETEVPPKVPGPLFNNHHVFVTFYKPLVVPPGPHGDVFSRRAAEETQRTD